MQIVRRISLMLFGLVSGLIGSLALLVSVVLMVSRLPTTHNPGRGVALAISVFVICEILAAFGVAALLLGLKCVLGPKQCISRVLDASWKKAMKFALVLPWLVIGVALIGRLIDWLAA